MCINFITDSVYDELLEKANAVASARVDALFGPQQQQQQPVDSSASRSQRTETRSYSSDTKSQQISTPYQAHRAKDISLRRKNGSTLEDTILPRSSHINDAGPIRSHKTYTDTSNTSLMNIAKQSQIRTFSVPINTTTNLEFDKPVRAEPQTFHTSNRQSTLNHQSTQKSSAFADSNNFFTPIEVQLPTKRTEEVHRVSASKPQRPHTDQQIKSSVHSKAFSGKPTKPKSSSSNHIPAPQIYQANSVDYSYNSRRNVSPIDLTDNFYTETTTRKLKPKDKKIYSHSTTEKVPIPSYEKDEVSEYVSLDVGHLRDVDLPEVSANSFGSPPKAVQDYFSKSHFEYEASDWPLQTPPIEKYRQRVVDKYLADKTRGGIRTYKSTFGHSSSSSYSPELEGYSKSTAALLARPPPPEPILYKPKSRSTTRLNTLNTSYTLNSSPEPVTGYYTAYLTRGTRPLIHRDADLTDGYYSDPEDFIKNTVQRIESKDDHLIPVDVQYSDNSEEEHTLKKHTERKQTVDERFSPHIENFFTPIEVELPSKRTEEVRRVTKQSVYNNRSTKPSIQQEWAHANGLDDIESNVQYIDPRQSRKPPPERTNRSNMSYAMNDHRSSSGQARQHHHRQNAQVNAPCIFKCK